MPRYLPRALRDKRGQGSRRPDTDEPTSDTTTASTATRSAAKAGATRAGARRPGTRTTPAQRTARSTGTSEHATVDTQERTDPARTKTDSDERRRPSPRRRDDEPTKDGAGTTKGSRPSVKAPTRPGSTDRRKGTGTARTRAVSNGRRPRGKAATRAAARAAARRRLVVTAVVLGVLTVLSGGVAGTAWYLQGQAQQLVDAREEARAAAVVAAKAVFSYDYRSFDQSVNNGKDFVTGDFAKEYAKTTSELKATAIKEKATVWSDVAAASISSATRDKVDVLLYVNQYRKNANITGQKVDQNRVVLTMVRVGADWKVSAASAL